MGLSCECREDVDDEWWMWLPQTYSEAPQDGEPVVCESCGKGIEPGATVVRFEMCRHPETDEEIKELGEEGEIPIRTVWHCEECGDLYYSLQELGFCAEPLESQHELVQEYHELYGPEERAAQARLKEEADAYRREQTRQWTEKYGATPR